MSPARRRGMLLAAGFALTRVALAAPTAGELRATCARALEGGYRGADAAMCDWYVAPCGVCGKDGPPQREWCVPEGLTPGTVAAQVVADLRGGDDTRPAPAAVKEILRRRYPCGTEE